MAQRATLSGFVRDAETGETLILANVVVRGTSLGTATNSAGYYWIGSIDAGTHTVAASFIGYREARLEIELSPGEDARLDIELVPDDLEIDEVVVTADAAEEEEARRIGATRLPAQTVRRLPTVLEPDVFRALQLLPGVKAASDFSSGLYIRGGSPDQTLILLDRNTVYNPTHFFGFFSTFNPDAIKDVRLYKGNYPAEYGGRLGSVVDVYNKEGNRRSLDGSLSLGLLASRAIIEGPYRGGSYMFAVRRSTLEPLLALLDGEDLEGIPDRFHFYDINGTINYDISPDDRLSLAVYGGRDRLAIRPFDDAAIDIAYGNQTIAANWVHLFSSRLFFRSTLAGSRYAADPVFNFGGTSFSRRNTVSDITFKGDLEYAAGSSHRIKAGIHAGRFQFSLHDAFDDEQTMSERIPSTYASVYVEDRFELASRWEVQIGLRGNYFGASRDVRIEPRLSLEFRPANSTRLQIGYGRYNQFLTLITSELFSGFDIWLTTGDNVPPSMGDQFGIGLKTSLGRGHYLDLEMYYRTMRGLFELDPFVSDPAGLEYHELFRFGDGYAYGAELFLEKRTGPITGFLGYTFGVTQRRFPFVNDGAYFPPRYDRTHALDVVGFYRLGRGWQVTSAFTYGTGQPYTEPASRYRLVSMPFGGGIRDVMVADYNNRRLPPYHRLDLGLMRGGRFFGFADYELQLQVINVYSRRNIWFFFYDFDVEGTMDRTEVPQIPIAIPNISLTLQF